MTRYGQGITAYERGVYSVQKCMKMAFVRIVHPEPECASDETVECAAKGKFLIESFLI